MRVKHEGDGTLSVVGISPLCADTLLRLPDWMESDDPEVRKRLLPPAYEDGKAEEEWRRYAGPELEHLFQSRLEIVRRDLEGMRRSVLGSAVLRIPVQHVTAWISALNAGRHALFVLSEADPRDVGSDLRSVSDPVQAAALLRIDILGWLQQLLVEAVG
jgi:hypothetical protein